MSKNWSQKKIEKELSFRTPKQVTAYRGYKDINCGYLSFAICPTCEDVIDRDYQRYCSDMWAKVEVGWREEVILYRYFLCARQTCIDTILVFYRDVFVIDIIILHSHDLHKRGFVIG